VKRSAFFAGMVWVMLVSCSISGFHGGVPQLGLIELLFFLGPLVVVPLGLELFTRLNNYAETSKVARAARLVQFPAALLVFGSFYFERGTPAAVLALPWFVVGSLLGCHGLKRLISPGWKTRKAACVIASFLYLPIGCAWLVASRFGLNPIGFQEPIVLLTAVHFHFAGFAAPLMTCAAAKPLANPSVAVSRVLDAVAVGVLVGPGMLAAGFVVGPHLKLMAALLLVTSEAGLGFLFLVACRHLRPRWTRVLVGLSAASVFGAMGLAGVWAIGEFPLQQFVHLAEMAKFHGMANALGFTICGLLGWIFSQPGTTLQNRGEI
jgi:hypothetical protein